MLGFEPQLVVVGQRGGGEVGAAAIAAVSDGVLHYYLSGTADAARDASPFKNVVVAMLDLADELELPLNLGGGVTAGDGLEEFKRGFANARAALPHPRGRLRPGRVRAAQPPAATRAGSSRPTGPAERRCAARPRPLSAAPPRRPAGS